MFCDAKFGARKTWTTIELDQYIKRAKIEDVENLYIRQRVSYLIVDCRIAGPCGIYGEIGRNVLLNTNNLDFRDETRQVWPLGRASIWELFTFWHGFRNWQSEWHFH